MLLNSGKERGCRPEGRVGMLLQTVTQVQADRHSMSERIQHVGENGKAQPQPQPHLQLHHLPRRP